jgi:hypothetical protein|nr:hypothetical protein [uncultured Comamonas sp.]
MTMVELDAAQIRALDDEQAREESEFNKWKESNVLFFSVILGLLFAYSALVFGAGAVTPRTGFSSRLGSFSLALVFTGMLLYLTFLSADRDANVVVWNAFGMSAKLTRQTGEGLFRLHAFSPLLSFIPLVLGLTIGALIRRAR